LSKANQVGNKMESFYLQEMLPLELPARFEVKNIAMNFSRTRRANIK